MKAKGRAYMKASEGRLTHYVDAALARWLKVAAAWEGDTASGLVARAIAEYLERHPPPGYPGSTQPQPQPSDVPAKPRPKRDAKTASTTKGIRTEWIERSKAAIERWQQLSAEGMSLGEAAKVLNSEGYVSAQGRPWTRQNLGRVLDRAGVKG